METAALLVIGVVEAESVLGTVYVFASRKLDPREAYQIMWHDFLHVSNAFLLMI